MPAGRKSRGGKARRKRRLGRRLLSLLVILVTLLASGIFLVVPWLGRRGDLNSLVEGIIGSVLEVPVRIQSIESQPLGRLTLTRLRSVSAEAKEKLAFSAEEISFFYDPVDLLNGKIRRVHLASPELFVNLDADLQGVARLPRAAAAQSSPSILASSEPALPAEPPFQVGELVVESGAARLRLEGRDLPLKRLRIEVFGLGDPEGQSYSVRAEFMGARLVASGGLEVVSSENGSARYRLPESRVSLEGLGVKDLLAWLLPEGVGSPAGGGGRGAGEFVRSGLLSLEGSLEGTWPEEVHLSLRSAAANVASGLSPSVGISQAELDMRFQAVVQGELDRVRFSASATGGGRVDLGGRSADEVGSLNVEGLFSRSGERGGELVIKSGEAGLVGGGQLKISGQLSPLFGDVSAGLDLAVELRMLRAQKLHDFLSEALAGSLPWRFGVDEGRVEGVVAVSGTLAAPEATGQLEVRDAALRFPSSREVFPANGRVSFEGLKFDRREVAGSVKLLELSTGSFDASLAERIAPSSLPAFPRLEGKGALRVRIEGAEFSRDRARGHAAVTVTLGEGNIVTSDDPQGFFGIDGAARCRLEIDTQRSETPFDAELNLGVREILLGDIYVALDRDERISLETAGRFRIPADGRPAGVEVDSFRFETPFTGPLEGAGSLERNGEAEEFLLAARAALPEIPTRRFFQAFVRDPYVNLFSALEDAALSGKSAVHLRAEGPLSRPVLAGSVHLEESTLTIRDFALEGLESDVPFVLGSAEAAEEHEGREGILAVRGMRKGPLALSGFRLPFRFAGGNYELTRRVVVPLLEGSVSVESLGLSPRTPEGPTVRMRVLGEGISLEAVTRAYGWPAIPAVIGFRFEPLRYRGGRLEVSGTLEAEGFGGRLICSDLTVDDVFEPYGSLRLGEGRAENINLQDLGRVFRFGIASGVIRGRLEGLEFTAGKLSAFRLDAETVPTPGVPQFLNREAVESLTQVLAGRFGVLERTLFSKFRYARFGFRSELENEIFRLRGKYRRNGLEYLMYGRWYQIPRISIINTNPEQPYDWARIVENLKRIYGEDPTGGNGG